MKTRRPAPLIGSSAILKGAATAMTLTALGGMTAFAGTHVQTASAPLQPTAPTTSAAPAATPAPTSRTSTARRSTTITGGIATTTAAPRTRTKSS